MTALRMQEYPSSATKTVLITGFGPFGRFTKNPSWECVKHLQGCIVREHQLVCVQLNVEYASVHRIIPQLLEKHRPMLMLLCGVYSRPGTDHIRLETLSHNNDYSRLDVCGRLPYQVESGGPPEIHSVLPIRQLVCMLRKRGHRVMQSVDPGRYLCDYSMYTALSANQCPSTFVHVPPVRDGAEVEEVVSFMYDLIGLSIDALCTMFQ